MGLAIRTSGIDIASLARSVGDEVRTLNSDQPVHAVRPYGEYFRESIGPLRLTLHLLGILATLAIVLASIGIYGVISYNVGLRSQEIGIRLALGATPRQVLTSIVLEGAALATAGLVLGLIGAVLLSRSLTALLYGLNAQDPAILALVSATLLAVALAASYLPARRAAKLAPSLALRQE